MAGGSDTLFEIFRGDDFTLRIEVTDEQGEVVDIRGWSFKATMKLNTEAPDKDAPVRVDIPALSDSDSEAENGVVNLVLPSEQTINLKPTYYFFDLQREFLTTVNTVLVGRVRVRSDVTFRRNDG